MIVFLLTMVPSPDRQGPSLPQYGVASVAAAPIPHWSGEFRWDVSRPDPTGSYTESGFGSFGFSINPTNNSVTGTGTGTETYQHVGAPGRCTGGGTAGYTFSLSGVYDPVFNDFNLAYATGSVSPQNFTFTMQPTQTCQPVTMDIDPIEPEQWIINATDGAMVTCSNSGCDGGITYEITIHGGQTSTTSSTTTSTTCTSNRDQKLIFYVEKDGFPSGHGFIQFQTSTGSQAGRPDLVYGHSSVLGPYDTGFTRGPGAPQHGVLEADHPWDWRIVFQVTPCQYNAAADFVNSEIDRPSTYSLTTLNCVDWIKYAASFAGLKLPPSTDWLGSSDPYTLTNSLAQIGNGGTFDGGVVQENTGGTAPEDTPDPPGPNDTLLASPVEVAQYAIQNASALAESQNSTLQRTTLQPVTVSTGGTLNVSLRNVAPNASLTVVDFGDGSSNATAALQYSHVYESPGTYHARVVVLTGASYLDEFTLDVNVAAAAAHALGGRLLANDSSSSSGVTVSIPIPTPTRTSTGATSATPQLRAEPVALIGSTVVGGGTGTTSTNSQTASATTTPRSSTASSTAITAVPGTAEVVVAVALLLRQRRNRDPRRRAPQVADGRR